jgi:NAD(P)-dependent dehydrogenase (short-subunit alcohol dehydrogenase family)
MTVLKMFISCSYPWLVLGRSRFATSKGALITLTNALAREFTKHVTNTKID